MVECSENNANFPDENLLAHFCSVIADRFSITPFLYFFWAGGIKQKSNTYSF